MTKDEITMNDMGALYGFSKALVNAARHTRRMASL